MESGIWVTRRIINEIHSSYIQGYQMAGESGATRSIIEELHSSHIQGHQMEGESGVTRSITDELLFPYIEGKIPSNGRCKWC